MRGMLVSSGTTDWYGEGVRGIHVKQRARHDQPVIPDQGVSSSFDALLAVGSQGELGSACVAPV